MFSNPYVIRDIENKASGFSTYNENLSKALESSNFRDYINSGAKEKLIIQLPNVIAIQMWKKHFRQTQGLVKYLRQR